MLRGKINIADSIKQNTIIKSSLVCEFDEFSENSLLNQVLKSVCILLIKKGNIEKDNKKRLKKILLYFSNVDEVEIDNINWKAISYHRNNATYKMLIHICYLIVKGLLIKTNNGNLVLEEFIQAVQYLADHKVDINSKYHGTTPLNYALAKKQTKTVEILLKAGAKPDENAYKKVANSKDEYFKDMFAEAKGK